MIRDPIGAIDDSVESSVPSLNIDEVILPSKISNKASIQKEEIEPHDYTEEDHQVGASVSTLRLKLAAAQLNDLHFDTQQILDSEGISPTIWSFHKYASVDEDTNTFIQDMERKIQSIRNRPHSSYRSGPAEDQDIPVSDEEFPETRSTDNLLVTSSSQGLENSESNNSAVLVAKFQAMLQDATYQPDASLQWQIDPERIKRFQALLATNEQNVHEDDENSEDDANYENDDDMNLVSLEDEGAKPQRGTPRGTTRHAGTADSKMDLSRIDYESKLESTTWCRDQQQQMMLAELEMEREMAVLTAALSQSAYELDAIDILTHSAAGEGAAAAVTTTIPTASHANK